MMLSIFLLKDHCGLYRIMIATLLTVGVVVISRHSALFSTQLDPTEPSANVTIDASENPVEKKTNADVLGVVFALTGAVLSAWVTILVRQVNHIHFSVQILWFYLSGVITSLLGKFMIDTTTYLFSSWTMDTWLLSVGQVEAFGTIPHCSDYIGAGLIVLAVLGIAVEEKIMEILKQRSRYF